MTNENNSIPSSDVGLSGCFSLATTIIVLVLYLVRQNFDYKGPLSRTPHLLRLPTKFNLIFTVFSRHKTVGFVGLLVIGLVG